MDRRAFVGAGVASLLGSRLAFGQGGRLVRARPVPSASQLVWQRDELAVFVHFGVNTFTDREWGDGREDPAIFAPAHLDARQWARAARAFGARAMVLTAKHHDGFCLWPTSTTRHSVASSPFRGGQGDVVREFVDACRAERLKVGLYLSPWDRNSPVYGDSPRYNDLYAEQLTELLTRYGDVHEVWFDGANGEGPNGKRQVYDWPRVWGLVRRLQPDAVMFSDAGPDVRWCGNERGLAGDPNWSTVNPEVVPYPGADSPAVKAMLTHGDPNGTVWRPAEVDVSIRPGWFHHPAEDDRVRSIENLVELYFSSVGRNGKLLLNVPPTRDGLFHATDVERLAGCRTELDAMFAGESRARDTRSRRPVGGQTVVEFELPATRTINVLRLEEDITRGQSVARHWLTTSLAGALWHPVVEGTTIGYARLHRVAPTTVRRLRLRVDYVGDEPAPLTLKLY